MIKTQKRFMKIIMLVVPMLVVVVLAGSDCYAVSKYNGKYDECMSAINAGVLEELFEIDHGKTTKEYMCSEAAANWNTCSLWIGSAESATIPTIMAYGEAGTVDIMYWGTCTDYANLTSKVWVDDDNDAIDDSSNVTRNGYPSFGGAATTLDIAKFVEGASSEEINECETKYTRTITVGRTHGGRDSSSKVRQTVDLIVIKDDCNEGNTCDDWKPASYTASNKFHGTTSIDIRIKNLAGRFGGTGFGAWNDNDIFAMPTDEIAWIACYYPGVQTTSDTDVGSLNGGDLGYTELYGYRGVNLPNNTCLENMPLAVEYEKLYVKVNKVSKWQNQFNMWGDADGGDSLIVAARGDSTIRFNEVTKKTQEGDAGETFTETAETGTPVKADIEVHTPTKDFRACTCETRGSCKTPGWNELKGKCLVTDEEGNCILHAGDWDYSEGYCQAWNWNTSSCSCCTDTNFATIANTGIDGKAPCTGANCETGTKNTYEKSLNDATVKFGPVSDSLSVRLPYNFTVSTAVSINTNLVYSGHENQITVNDVTTTVHQRENAVTLATYATEVPTASILLYAYVSGSSDGGGIGGSIGGDGNVCSVLGDKAKQCLELKSKSQELNGNGKLAGATDTIWSNLIYNAFDASAGDYMCFASSVSPSRAAGNTDMVGGDGSWIYSDPKCAVIAKKPTFQVWGSSLYSVGNIDSKYNSKVNIYKSYKSDIASKWKQSGGNNTYFYPWVEESLIIKDGITQSVSSGAAGGLNSEDATGGAGVGTGDTFCKNGSALSFANYSTTIGNLCNGGTNRVGESGIDSGIKNREELIEYWVGADISEGALAASNVAAGTTLNLSQPDSSVWKQIDSATGARIRYGYSNGGVNVSGDVPQGTTYLIRSDDVVTITGNITYTNATMFSQIPKVIIYAKRGVNIKCNVKEVDAIIITGENNSDGTGTGFVDTCETNEGVDDSVRSNRLKIFGMVITDKITLGRTYGSAANKGDMKDPVGTPSDGAAAEIFDFDSSILMWSEFMAGSNESDTLQTVYQHEIAPRY